MGHMAYVAMNVHIMIPIARMVNIWSVYPKSMVEVKYGRAMFSA